MPGIYRYDHGEHADGGRIVAEGQGFGKYFARTGRITAVPVSNGKYQPGCLP